LNYFNKNQGQYRTNEFAELNWWWFSSWFWR
jgi:hypothetical protein